MSTKIAMTLHLTKGQWRTLQHLMMGASRSTPDQSVKKVADIVERAAREATKE